MADNVKEDLARRAVAIEIIAAMIGTLESRKQKKNTTPEVIARIEAEAEMLRRERAEIYSGNKETIAKALTVYAKEIRVQRER
ncbi:MAG: hypothetical protein P4N41_00580 [Negativicutes bacterium]|nr:hypothetical protein [Negativicutes bacterium]